MGGSSEATMDDNDLTMDFLEDGEFEDERDGETLVSARTSSCALRRKIEERLERRRLCEELGLTDDELEL